MSLLLSDATTLPPVEFPDDFDRYEVIDGVRVEMPPMSADSTGCAVDLCRYLSNYGIERGMGKAYSDMLVKLPLPVDRNRRPDAIFVPFDRWAKGRALPSTNAWDVLPDLCVEVVSPSDLAEEQWEKVREYFRSGVKAVWVIHPRHHTVHAYDSTKSARVLERSDVLDGGELLPGFSLPLADLFPDPAAQM